MFKRSPGRKKKEHSQPSFPSPPPPPPPPPLPLSNDDDDDNSSMKRFFSVRPSPNQNKRKVLHQREMARIVSSMDEEGSLFDDNDSLLLSQNYQYNTDNEDDDYQNDNASVDNYYDNASLKRRFRLSPKRDKRKSQPSPSFLALHPTSSSGSFDDIYKGLGDNIRQVFSSSPSLQENESVILYGVRNHNQEKQKGKRSKFKLFRKKKKNRNQMVPKLSEQVGSYELDPVTNIAQFHTSVSQEEDAQFSNGSAWNTPIEHVTYNKSEDDDDDDDDDWTTSFPTDPFDGFEVDSIGKEFNNVVSQKKESMNIADNNGMIPIRQIHVDNHHYSSSENQVISEMSKYDNYSKSLVQALEVEQSHSRTPVNHLKHPDDVQWSHDNASIASSMGDSLNTFQDLPLMHMQDFMKLDESDRVQAYCDLFTMAGAMMRDVEEKREEIFLLARQVDELHKRVRDVEDSKSQMHQKNEAHREEVKMLQTEVESKNVVIENLKRAMDEWKSQEEQRAEKIVQNSSIKPSDNMDFSKVSELKDLKETIKTQKKKIEEKDKEIRMKNLIIDEQTMQLKSSRRDTNENEVTIRELKDSLNLKEFLWNDVKQQLATEKKKRKKLKRAYLRKVEADTSGLIARSRASDPANDGMDLKRDTSSQGLDLQNDSDLGLDIVLSISDEIDAKQDDEIVATNIVTRSEDKHISSDGQSNKPNDSSFTLKISDAIQRFTPNPSVQKTGVSAGSVAVAKMNSLKDSVGVSSYMNSHRKHIEQTGIVKKHIAVFNGNMELSTNTNSISKPELPTDIEKLSKQLQERDHLIESMKDSHSVEVNNLMAQKIQLEDRLTNLERLYDEAHMKLGILEAQKATGDSSSSSNKSQLVTTEDSDPSPDQSSTLLDKHARIESKDSVFVNVDNDVDDTTTIQSHSKDRNITTSSEPQASSEPTEERKEQVQSNEEQKEGRSEQSTSQSQEIAVMHRQQKLLVAKIKSLEDEVDTVSGLLEETILSMREKENDDAPQDPPGKRASDYSDEDVQQLERICKLHQLTIIRQRKQARAILTELENAKVEVKKHQIESKAQEDKISILESQFAELNQAMDQNKFLDTDESTENSPKISKSSIIKIDAGYLSSLEAKSGMSVELTNQIKELKIRNETLQEKLSMQSDINEKLDDLTLKLQAKDMEISVLKEKIDGLNTLGRHDSTRAFPSRGRSPAFGSNIQDARRSPDLRRSPSFGSRVLSRNESNNSLISLDYSTSDDDGEKRESKYSKLKIIIAKRDETIAHLKDKISNLEKTQPSGKGYILDLRKISLLQELLEASVRRLNLVITRQNELNDVDNKANDSSGFILSFGDKLSLLHDNMKISLHLIESRLANELESLNSGKEIVSMDEGVLARFDRCLDSLHESEQEIMIHLEKLNIEFNRHKMHVEVKDEVITTLIRKDNEQKDNIDNLEMELKVFKGLSEYQSVNLGMINRLKECSRLEQELEEKERVIQRLNNVIEEYRSYEDKQ
jgi:hypothetical protein